jgi:hypothetical protein
LIANGVHPKKIAERLGHASIKLTMDTYGHLFEGSDRESADVMERLFGEKKADAEAAAPVGETAANVVMMQGRISGHADKNADKRLEPEGRMPVSA